MRPLSTTALTLLAAALLAVLHGHVSLGAGVRHAGAMELNRLPTPSYTVFDAALRYQVDKWRFALNVKNLTDKTYLASCSFACFHGDERNVTLSARYTW